MASSFFGLERLQKWLLRLIFLRDTNILPPLLTRGSLVDRYEERGTGESGYLVVHAVAVSRNTVQA